jgi:opacity protein-like surface antigen
MGKGRMTFVALAALAGLGVWAGSASAAQVKNGNFERGNLSGWQKDFSEGSAWFIYDGPFSPLTGPIGTVPAPPQGEFGAISDQGNPSRMILSQVVDLKPGKKHKLKFQLAYNNENTGIARRGIFPGFRTPKNFRFGKGAAPNQQFRMDVMKPGASIKSLKKNQVLDRVYRTDRGDPNNRGYRAIRANLTEFAGDKVRLRFAVVVTEAPLNVGIDAVKIKTKN